MSSSSNPRRTVAQLRAGMEEVQAGLHLNVEVQRGVALIEQGTDPSEHIHIVTALLDMAK